MALLKNCEVHHVKCDPKRPSGRFDKTKPRWEVQLRTTNPEQKDEWIRAGLKPKLIVGKAGTEDEGIAVLVDGKRQWRLNLSKKSKTRTGEEASPVEVLNGACQPIDPNTIGNGSICHVRMFQYEFTGADGEKAKAAVLMGLQVKKHIVYNRTSHDDEFEMEDTETVIPEDDDDVLVQPAQTASSPSPAQTAPAPKLADARSPNVF